MAVSLLYSFAAHDPIREPWIVPSSPLDDRIPLRPASAWVYASYVLLLPALVLFGRHRPGFARVFATGVSCALLNALIYILFPALEERTVAPAGTLLAAIQALDTTLCALPSGHVALPTSLTIAAWLISGNITAAEAWWRRVTQVLMPWTLTLSASTLLTKQHYVVDVAAGALYGTMVAATMTALAVRRQQLGDVTGRAGIGDALDRAA